MSSKFKSSLLLIAFLAVLSILVYMLKDVTTGNSKEKEGTLYDANYYNDLGNRLIKQEKFNEAIVNFNKAIEISKNTPQFYIPYSGRAIARYNLSDCIGAISDAEIVLTGKNLASADIGSMYSTIGICEFVIGKDKESIEHLTKAINLNPKNDRFAWMNYSFRAASELDLKDLEHAKIDLFKALELNKNEYSVYKGLCKYYIDKEEYLKALFYLKKRREFINKVDIDDYFDGYKIYTNILVKHLEKNDSERQKYIDEAIINQNKLYEIQPSALNQFNLCILYGYLNKNNLGLRV